MSKRCGETTTRVALALTGLALIAILFLTARAGHDDPARHAAHFDAARACGDYTLIAGD